MLAIKEIKIGIFPYEQNTVRTCFARRRPSHKRSGSECETDKEMCSDQSDPVPCVAHAFFSCSRRPRRVSSFPQQEGTVVNNWAHGPGNRLHLYENAFSHSQSRSRSRN